MIKANFMAIAGMAGVVGAIDGTHIQIIAASKDEDVFVNRKKVHTSTRRLLLMQLLTFLMLRSGLQGLPMIRRLSLQDVLTPYLSPQPGAVKEFVVTAQQLKEELQEAGWVDQILVPQENQGLAKRLHRGNHHKEKHIQHQQPALPTTEARRTTDVVSVLRPLVAQAGQLHHIGVGQFG
ncbi:hypothetical protein N1851_034369 [Merluccius polli]|uniref:DDE Tnp4 domain-containing protein n=1 Tax=Merluccius polli TaxID=89951 RepID=A0AA47LZY8_MERPO|nr:hypothetical protein N1851_034369 [Merluccius polli]